MTRTASEAPEARRAQAREYCDAGRWGEGLPILQSILRRHPEAASAYVDLGDCYMAANDGATASQLYARALALEPDDVQLQERLRTARQRVPAGADPVGERDPLHTAAIRRLADRLSRGKDSVPEEQIERAEALLRELAVSRHPAQDIGAHLGEIGGLLPALIEVNVRQARHQGRTDVVAALEGIRQQMRALPAPPPGQTAPTRPARVLFVAPRDATHFLPRELPLRALAAHGVEASLADAIPIQALADLTAVVVRHPHAAPSLLEGMAACAAAGVRLIIDLEADCEQMPFHHPAYPELGLATPQAARAYAAALLLADTILVPSPMFAATLRSAGHRAHVLPHAWSADNALWAQPPAPRHTVNIGWLGGAGQVEDLALIRRVLIRLAREFPQIQIVVGGEPQAFHLFDSLPEGRKLYLPPAPLAEVPYQLSHLDILVEPLRTTPFHRTLSDRQVMHASARGLAWVASPTPSHRSWADGGVTADDPDEWHTQLRRLVEDPGLRAALGEAGRLKAQEREATRLAGAWLDILRAPPPARSALVASGAPAFIPPAEASVQWRGGASARAAV